MTYVAEFEFYTAEDGTVIAEPLGVPAQEARGCDLESTVIAAQASLERAVDEALLGGTRLPGWRVGHEPQRGGQVIAIAVTRELSGVAAVSAADAAGILGVSRSRVGQLCSQGLLDSWKEGRSRMVSLSSLHARLQLQDGGPKEQGAPGR